MSILSTCEELRRKLPRKSFISVRDVIFQFDYATTFSDICSSMADSVEECYESHDNLAPSTNSINKEF